jgi:hypothetical protein
MTITAGQKAEWQEATEQADAAIARLNDLYVATGRDYRVRRTHYKLDLFPDLDDDLDGGTPIDGYRPSYSPGNDRVGSERAEREDECADQDADQDEREDES